MGWIKNQLAALSLAMSSVEKNALSQDGQRLSDNTRMVQRHTQGMMYDSLINGELTEEVKLLRARLYKVIEATDNVVVKGLQYTDSGEVITGATQNVILEHKPHKSTLKKVIVDTEDDYPLDMVILNQPYTLSKFDGVDINAQQPIPLVVSRDFHPRFLIERYTTKLVVRKISDVDKLLEFYIPIYPKQFDVNSKLFLKYFIAEREKPKSDLFDINGVEFITENNDIGVDYGYLHEFEDLILDKIIEFDGNYVVKYKGKITNMEDVREYFRDEELDEKYKNKEKRKKRGED